MRILALIVSLFLTACSAGADISAVNAAAHHVHELQMAGEDATIYAEADDGLRAGADLHTLTRINTAVRSANCESEFPVEATTWNLNAHTSGYFVTLTYQRQCQQSPFVETFTFKKVGNVWRMFSYNANGAALLPQVPAAPQTEPPAAPATPEETIPAPSTDAQDHK